MVVTATWVCVVCSWLGVECSLPTPSQKLWLAKACEGDVMHMGVPPALQMCALTRGPHSSPYCHEHLWGMWPCIPGWQPCMQACLGP